MNQRHKHKMFEYIHHMFYENKTIEDLCFDDHQSNGYTMDQWLIDYYECIVHRLAHLSKGKSVLDVGCEIGSKIDWFNQAGAKEYVGIDPDPKHIYYAQICSNIVKMPCNLYTETAENFDYGSYDTGFLLSVTHHLSNQELVIEKLCKKCNNLVIDTWVNSNTCKSLEYYTNLLTLFDHKILDTIEIKKNRYFIISNKI